MNKRLTERIICLSDEKTELLYLLGEEHRILGISCFSVRPSKALVEKTVISSFTGANIKKIIRLKPDLILGFSDLQADIIRDLIKAGLQVHVFNQRTIQEILNMVRMLGSMVGAHKKAEKLIAKMKNKMDRVWKKSEKESVRPKVYFEEWPDPLICGIGWVSELIGIAGGIDCFEPLARNSLARDRVIWDQTDVLKSKPDIVIGSWCGKRFRPEIINQRKDWDQIPAVRNGDIYEIKSSDILQPGAAALTDGLEQLYSIISIWRRKYYNR